MVDLLHGGTILRYFYTFQVHLDIQVGEHAVDYANVAQKDKLTELQLRIRQLLDQVHQITKEQSYQRVSNFFFLRGYVLISRSATNPSLDKWFVLVLMPNANTQLKICHH